MSLKGFSFKIIMIVLALGLLLAALITFVPFGLVKSKEGPHSLNSNGFQQVDCWFDNSEASIQAQCGYLFSKGELLTYKLPVVVLQSNDNNLHEKKILAQKPIMYLGGGPGAGLGLDKRAINHWIGWYQRYQLSQPLILMDYRSTGLSTPQFQCTPFVKAYSDSILAPEKVSSSDLYTITRDCFRIWRDRGYSTFDFTIENNAYDVLALAHELQISEFDIYSVSYGTRVALALTQIQPERIGRIVLDSPVSPTQAGVNFWPSRLSASFIRYFAYCATEKTCTLTEKQLFGYLKELAAHSLAVEVVNWSNNLPVNIHLTDHLLVSALYSDFLKFSTLNTKELSTSQLLVDNREFRAFIEEFINHAITDDFNFLVYYANTCLANKPYNPETYTSQYVPTQWQPYTRYRPEFDVCQLIENKKIRQLPFHRINNPTLILAGALDSVTPIEGAQQIYDDFEQVILAVFSQSSHGVLSSNTCLQNVLPDFYNNITITPSQFDRCDQSVELKNKP